MFDVMKIGALLSIIVFAVGNLIFLLAPVPKHKGISQPTNVEPPTPNEEKTLLDSLVKALWSYNIKHNTKGLAQEVIRENPEVQDLETLIGLAMKKIRDKYR